MFSETLTLNGNQELVGRMDSQVLSVLPKLRVVDLSFTKFEGSIPNQIASCKRLNELRLWKVAISGTIPTELGSCTSLSTSFQRKNVLDFFVIRPFRDHNDPNDVCVFLFILSCPFWIPHISIQKERLVVGGTDRMLGTIPSELGRLIDLYELKLSWIPFVKATIPTSLANLSKLQEFSLRSSHLIGTLPIEYGSNLSSLQTFDVSLNPSVTGTIPTEYGLLSNLSTFSFLFEYLLVSVWLYGSRHWWLGRSATYLCHFLLAFLQDYSSFVFPFFALLLFVQN